jgi:hypothetical protein
MDLIKVEENAVTVELSWTDCALLAHIIREARYHDALPTAPDFGLVDAYARSVEGLLEGAGLASYADFGPKEDYTLEHFRALFGAPRREAREAAEAAARLAAEGGEAA